MNYGKEQSYKSSKAIQCQKMLGQVSGEFSREILLQRYEVQQELSKKAGRRTLLARDLQTQELVVVKLLLFNNEFEWGNLKLFEREAEILKALEHPAIPRYIDYFELDSASAKGFALVQGYIPALSLEVQLKAGRSFSEADVRQLTKALLEILKYLHSRQPPVIHRDVKPSNILLTNRSANSVGEVYLIDFGSVQTVSKKSSTMTVVGTYGYMPPEQFLAKATPTSDLYSLGATLIYLVTGQHPAELPQTDLRIEFEQVANISPGFYRWLRKMTEPIASKRFASAEKALQALEQIENQAQTLPNLTFAGVTHSKLRKPSGSKVVLNKDMDFLEIIIPSPGLFSSVSLTCFILYGFLIFIFSLLSIGSHSSFTFLIFFIIFPIAFIHISVCLFGRKRLYINREYISLSYEFLEIQRRVYPSLRQDIMRLGINKDVVSNKIYLTIWAGLKKYEIFTDEYNIFAVTLLELEWLAHELSDWLDLPITKE